MSSTFDKKTDPDGHAVSVHVGTQNPPSPVDAWDLRSPKSILSMIPDSWRPSFLIAKEMRPELFELDERSLYKALKSESLAPSPTINTIRLKFWMEYERVQSGDGRRIEMFRVLGEVCRGVNFVKFILSRPERVAWIMCPPTTYKTKIEEALDFGLSKLRDILELDVLEAKVDKNGNVSYRPNVKLGELQAKIVNMLDTRLHGQAKQQIDHKVTGRTLNVNVDARDVAAAIEDATADDLDHQLKMLEARERRSMHLDAIPVESKPVADPKDLPDLVEQEEIEESEDALMAMDLVDSSSGPASE